MMLLFSIYVFQIKRKKILNNNYHSCVGSLISPLQFFFSLQKTSCYHAAVPTQVGLLTQVGRKPTRVEEISFNQLRSTKILNPVMHLYAKKLYHSFQHGFHQ